MDEAPPLLPLYKKRKPKYVGYKRCHLALLTKAVVTHWLETLRVHLCLLCETTASNLRFDQELLFFSFSSTPSPSSLTSLYEKFNMQAPVRLSSCHPAGIHFHDVFIATQAKTPHIRFWLLCKKHTGALHICKFHCKPRVSCWVIKQHGVVITSKLYPLRAPRRLDQVSENPYALSLLSGTYQSFHCGGHRELCESRLPSWDEYS